MLCCRCSLTLFLLNRLSQDVCSLCNNKKGIVVCFVVDIAIQATVQYTENQSIDLSKIDVGRAFKIGFQTGLGTAIPCLGVGAGNGVDAIGTALIWIEGTALISISDVIITKLFS